MGAPGSRASRSDARKPQEAGDLLVLSAFPNDDLPTPSSLIGALYQKNLLVANLARDKELDLRANFSCWLSKEFAPPHPGIQFSRLLCFEPLVRGKPPQVVGDIFRSLAPILGDLPNISTVAIEKRGQANNTFEK